MDLLYFLKILFEYIVLVSQGKSFTSITKAAISKNEEIIPPFTPFSLSASSRGKVNLIK